MDGRAQRESETDGWHRGEGRTVGEEGVRTGSGRADGWKVRAAAFWASRAEG